MTLQQLRYLTALDDHRHFGQAAKSCYVAQPTLTLQLKKLEQELGVQLFDRSNNPITPTPLGTKVIYQARNILNEVEGLRGLLNDETESVAGEFVVGIIPTLSPYLVPLFIRSFSEQFPEAKLRIRELQSEDIITGLLRNNLDIGLLVTPLEEKQLREIVLFHEPFLIYASPEEDILQQSPLLPDHVQRKDIWILEKGHCFRNQVLNICDGQSDLSINSNFSFEAGSIETLKNLVRNNLGYTIVPEMSIDLELDKSLVKRFAEPQPAREVSLVVNKNFSR
ncbi:MAG: hydrogen peroxide-inducible genes activator, partial [Bacteroidota bacterium]